jgi:F-type H+-transporting ATPase subunit b
MEEQLSTSTVLLNVGIQILNLVVFFLLFKFLLGDKVAKELDERERTIKKLKNAESEYNAIIQQAEKKKDLILSEALQKQRTILQEGETLNKKLNQEMVEDAKRKADEIIVQASMESKRTQEELAQNREAAVKKTTKSVVRKLLNTEKELQDDYLKTLIDDIQG